MRRNEITPKLIELSKRAKELGFPQDIGQGDWVIDLNGQKLWIVDWEGPPFDSILILSFSRCLEWLRERDWHVTFFNYRKEIGGAMVEVAYIKKAEKVKQVRIDAKTHHEAIAKAVIKILEEKND